jgi:hypothetical protein
LPLFQVYDHFEVIFKLFNPRFSFSFLIVQNLLLFVQLLDVKFKVLLEIFDVRKSLVVCLLNLVDLNTLVPLPNNFIELFTHNFTRSVSAVIVDFFLFHLFPDFLHKSIVDAAKWIELNNVSCHLGSLFRQDLNASLWLS